MPVQVAPPHVRARRLAGSPTLNPRPIEDLLAIDCSSTSGRGQGENISLCGYSWRVYGTDAATDQSKKELALLRYPGAVGSPISALRIHPDNKRHEAIAQC